MTYVDGTAWRTARQGAVMSRKFPVIARVLLGVPFLVFGLNFFVPFLPQPAIPPEAGVFLGSLVAGKLLLIVKTAEVATALLLLGNRFVPLALALLAPVEVGIVMFHATFEPAGLPLPLVLVALTVYLAWSYRAAFAPMLRARTQPAAAEPTAAAHRTATA
jgi:uncharacterized membrane protein YphA (DoxX/SURF4 family)